MQGMTWGVSLFEEALLDFEAQDPNVEWYAKTATQCHSCGIEKIRARKKDPDIIGSVFSKGWMELNPLRNQSMCQAWLKLQFAFHLLLPRVLLVYRLPCPLPPPVKSFFDCSLSASPCRPAVVVYYCAFQGIVL